MLMSHPFIIKVKVTRYISHTAIESYVRSQTSSFRTEVFHMFPREEEAVRRVTTFMWVLFLVLRRHATSPCLRMAHGLTNLHCGAEGISAAHNCSSATAE
jgi:hypothetical protein